MYFRLGSQKVFLKADKKHVDYERQDIHFIILKLKTLAHHRPLRENEKSYDKLGGDTHSLHNWERIGVNSTKISPTY